MFCANCGKLLEENTRFCSNCGAPAAANAAPPAPSAGPFPGTAPVPAPGADLKRVTLCPDGKYRWTYEMSLFKNPTILLLIWKIFFFIVAGIFVFIGIMDAANSDDFFPDRFLNDLMFFGIFVAGMTVLVGVSYLIYAAIMGGKYIVDFEMDEKGINHAQAPAQAKKVRKIGQATMLVGIATHNYATVGAGLGAQRTETYSEFAKIRKVKGCPRRGLIKIRAALVHNQVYVQNEDFDFVLNYITARCPNAEK